MAALHILLPTGSQQHVNLAGAGLGGPQHLKIQGYLFEGIGNVLIGLEADLQLHGLVVEVLRHLDDLGNHRRPGDRAGCVGTPGLGLGNHLADGLDHGVPVTDILLNNRIGRERPHHVALHPIPGAGPTQLNELYRRRSNVQPQDIFGFNFEKTEHSHYCSLSP